MIPIVEATKRGSGGGCTIAAITEPHLAASGAAAEIGPGVGRSSADLYRQLPQQEMALSPAANPRSGEE